MPQGNRAPEGHEVPVVRARLHNGTHSALQRDLGGDRVDQRGAGSFWPRKLSAAPIGVFFKCKPLFKALVEHFIPRLQVVDEEETVGFPRRLLIQPVQLLLWQQG